MRLPQKQDLMQTKDTFIQLFFNFTNSFSELVRFLMYRAREFSVVDFALMKLCLVSFGLWLGSKFSNFFKKFRIVIFISFILSFAYMFWRVFICEENK